jgi:hypothetical protein
MTATNGQTAVIVIALLVLWLRIVKELDQRT